MAVPKSFKWGEVGEELFPTPNPYSGDAVRWVRERRKAWVTRQQAKVLESVALHRKTAVHSAHDLGKSFTASNLAGWWIDTHPHRKTRVVTTAPTHPQVHGVLWQELIRMQEDAELPGEILENDTWKIGRKQVALGRSVAKPASFQGIHDTFVLVVIDEACGVDKAIFDAVSSFTANENCRIVAIGNPDDPTSYFAEVCKPGSGWNVIHLDGLESPNLTDEKDETPQEVLENLLSKTYVEESKKSWGETSPVYVAKIRGLFPEDASDGVVRASAVAKCSRGLEYLPSDSRLAPVELGVDIGAGSDKTVIVVRHGMRPQIHRICSSRDPAIVTGYIVEAIKELRPTSVKIDIVGWGWGVFGHVKTILMEEGINCEVIGVNVAESPTSIQTQPGFLNLRAQIWWEIGRVMSDEQLWDLSLVGDQCLADLLAPTYHPSARGLIQIEAKDEIRKRLGRSPDLADALLLAYYSGKHGLESYLDTLMRERNAAMTPPPGIDPHPLTTWNPEN